MPPITKTPEPGSATTIGDVEFHYVPGADATLSCQNWEHVAEVKIDPLFVAETRATKAELDEYAAVMGENTYGIYVIDKQWAMHILARGTKEEMEVYGNPKKAERLAEKSGFEISALQLFGVKSLVPNPARLKDLSTEFSLPNAPAVRLSYYEAEGYLDYKSELTGRKWRLMTQDEREFAAEGGVDLTTMEAFERSDTSDPFGLKDMMGYPGEWTSSVSADEWGVHRIAHTGGWMACGAQGFRTPVASPFRPTMNDNEYIGFRAVVEP